MTTRYLTVSEGSIAYDEIGTGTPVICMPGMGDLRQQYRFLAPQLAGFRTVAADIRGHGETSVKWSDYSVAGLGSDILALVRHLQAGPAIVIGNSMAAGAAVWAAVEAPESVRALVLLGPAVHGEVGLGFRLLLDLLFARPWGPWAWKQYYKTLYPSQKPSDWGEYLRALKQNIGEKGRLEALHQMMLASKAASAERLERNIVPTLVVMGSKDPDFKDPAAEADWVSARVGGNLAMVEGAGHYPHTEMPDITGPIIRKFLESLPMEAAHAQTGR